MPKFLIQVTETINHAYLIEADTQEEALSDYYYFDNDQLKSLDVDGQSCWDSHPWEVTEVK